MRLHTPLHRVGSLYPLPTGRLAITDVVSDGIRHNEGSEFYWSLDLNKVCF